MCIFVGDETPFRPNRRLFASKEWKLTSASVRRHVHPKQLCGAACRPCSGSGWGFSSLTFFVLLRLLPFYLFYPPSLFFPFVFSLFSLSLLGFTPKIPLHGFVSSSLLCLLSSSRPPAWTSVHSVSFFIPSSVENGLLLFSPSPQSIIFLHAPSASLAAVVSNWCFSVSAFILCLFFFFPLPLIVPIFASHLPPLPFCICGKRQASDRLPPCLCAMGSILWGFLDSSFLHLAAVVMPSLYGLIRQAVDVNLYCCTQGQDTALLCIFFTIHPQTLLI